MKKIFIGLLCLAAGVTAYFVINKKQQTSSAEEIAGVWRLDKSGFAADSADHSTMGLLALLDSNLFRYSYHFRRDGIVNLALGDSLTSDSATYRYQENEMLWIKDFGGDTSESAFRIRTINNDSLILRDKDSSDIVFLRIGSLSYEK